MAFEPGEDVVAIRGLDALRVCSLNHRACGLPGLAEVSAGADASLLMHEALTFHRIESAVLATCNRTELYWRSSSPADDHVAMLSLASAVHTTPDIVAQRSESLSGAAAAHHLFRVCSGLESLVLGEAEILGQVRAAIDLCPGAGPFLVGVFRAAIRTGRAARAETGIGAGALSVASTAIHWLAECLPLSLNRVMVIGAGKTGEKTARHLSHVGVGSLVIANRTLSQAEALASRVGAVAVGLDALNGEVERADAVISAVNAPGWVLTLDQIKQRARTRNTPLVVVDLSMPPSVEPGQCEGLIRVDLATLEESARENRKQREAEIPKVEAVIARELDYLRMWARKESLRPLMTNLRQRADKIRSDELTRARAELAQSADPHSVLERFSRRLFDRMLAVPVDELPSS